MALTDLQDFLKLIPAALKAPGGSLSTSYDAEADAVYVNFRKPSHATDSEIIGLTILHASQR